MIQHPEIPRIKWSITYPLHKIKSRLCNRPKNLAMFRTTSRLSQILMLNRGI